MVSSAISYTSGAYERTQVEDVQPPISYLALHAKSNGLVVREGTYPVASTLHIRDIYHCFCPGWLQKLSRTATGLA
jgi:hypothetical protein